MSRQDWYLVAVSLLAIAISLASMILSVVARRRQERAAIGAWLASEEMDPDYTPPSASLNPDAQP